MKQLFIFTATILACMGMRAQETGIDSVLRQIEANNKELQANAQLISSQKLESRTENNLPDPTLSYAHLWDSKNSGKTVGEMVVSQSFDFPTLYITRGKMNRLKTGALDAQAATMRQQILLQAKEVCLDIIMLQHQQELLDARLKNAEELAAMYAKRLATGDANALETNKINLELLNVRTESRMNSTALNNKIKELLVLNGNQPLTPGRPFPDGPAVPHHQSPRTDRLSPGSVANRFPSGMQRTACRRSLSAIIRQRKRRSPQVHFSKQARVAAETGVGLSSQYRIGTSAERCCRRLLFPAVLK